MTGALPVPRAAGGPVAAAADPGALTRLVAGWLLAAGSPHTRRAYRRDLEQWAGWLGEHDVTLFAARRPHVDAWAETLRRQGRAPATIARKLATLSSFYGYAIAEGAAYGIEVTADPAARARRPRIDRDHSETRGLDAGQARALIAAADAEGAAGRPRAAAIVRLMTEVGLRVADVAGADVADFGAERGHYTLTVTRKGGRRQKLALPPGVAHAVERAIGGRRSGPVVATRAGRPMAASEVFRTVRRIARKAGITAGITPHSLRHTAATLALDAGAPLRDVQDMLGHADPRTTRRYDRARESLDRAASYKIAALLGV